MGHGPHETSRRVVEIALFWGGDLSTVTYVAPTTRLRLADLGVPETAGAGVNAPIAMPFGAIGSVTETRVGAFEVRASLVYAARRAARYPFDGPGVASVAFAACVHALLFGAVAWTASVSPEPELGAQDIGLLRSYLARSDGDSTTQADGDEGARGGASPQPTLGKATTSDSPERADEARVDAPATRAAMLDEARTFGVLGLLARTGEGRDESMPWASPSSDATSAMWGDAIGESYGVAGVSLSGVGEESGGAGVGVALDRIGTVVQDGGRGVGHLGGHRTATIVCHLRQTEALITGRLPPETIQRVVRDNFGRFRGCYEKGLARDPSLGGRVTTKFVIARDGSVSVAADAGSDLADTDVVSCVNRTFAALTFPEPGDGVVTVVYPISFSSEP